MRPGLVIGGDFEILRPLSEGGMGAVYVAKQQSTQEERALKLMLPQVASNEALRQRFMSEARVGARIQSDHVVRVVAAGVDEESGAPWLAMELLEGSDLAGYVRAHGPPPRELLVMILQQLAHALGAAHDVGVIHRDLKPENIFLAKTRRVGAERQVKILDFGIAKITADAKSAASLAIGTPLWMAPEQTTAGERITPATDVWAVGLIVFYLLTGKVFWRAGHLDQPPPLAIIRESCLDPIPSASQRASELGVAAALPDGFDAWFDKTVSRDPLARFSSVREALGDLLALLSLRSDLPSRPRSIEAPATSPPIAAASPLRDSANDGAATIAIPVRRRGAVLVLTGLGALLAIIVGVVFLLRGDEKRRPKTADTDSPATATSTETVDADIVVPTSTITVARSPDPRTQIFVSKTAVRIGDNRTPVVKLDAAALAGATPGAPSSLVTSALAKALAQQPAAGDYDALIVADQSTPFGVLMEVLGAVSEAGHRNYHFRVRTKYGGVLRSVVPDAATPDPLGLMITLRDDGLALTVRAGAIARGCAGIGEGVTVPTGAGGVGDYDLRELTRCVRAVADSYTTGPRPTQVRIAALPTVEYRHVIAVIDAVRRDDEGELFPEFQLVATPAGSATSKPR